MPIILPWNGSTIIAKDFSLPMRFAVMYQCRSAKLAPGSLRLATVKLASVI
jgi:hypothetical protein